MNNSVCIYSYIGQSLEIIKRKNKTCQHSARTILLVIYELSIIKSYSFFLLLVCKSYSNELFFYFLFYLHD